MNRDERAKALIETEIRRNWPDIVRSVSVTPRIDYLDEPALDVRVELKSVELVPASLRWGAMLARLDDLLKESGDGRGAHMTFSAPDMVPDLDSDEDDELSLARR